MLKMCTLGFLKTMTKISLQWSPSNHLNLKISPTCNYASRADVVKCGSFDVRNSTSALERLVRCSYCSSSELLVCS